MSVTVTITKEQYEAVRCEEDVVREEEVTYYVKRTYCGEGEVVADFVAMYEGADLTPKRYYLSVL